ELINLILARDEGKKKIIYGGVGPGFETIGSAIISKTEEIYAGYPDHLFRAILTSIFGKIVPVLEAGEALWLKRGYTVHCAEVKGRLGLLALGITPKPDVMVTSGCMCETNPKTHDLATETWGITTYYAETCRDIAAGNRADFNRALELGAKDFRRLIQQLQEEVGFGITDDDLTEVLRARGKIAEAISRVRGLIEISDPLPLSATHDVLLHYLAKIVFTVDDLEKDPVDAVNTLYEELKDRVDRGIGVVEKGAPRIIALMPPSSGGPELEHLVNEVGIALVAAETGFYMPDGARKPDIGDIVDPYRRMYTYLYASGSLNTKDRIAAIIGACKRLSVEGVLGRYHVGCRTVAGDALICKSAITKELGIPVLLLEWENFDPRVHEHELFKRRLEVFKSIMRPT
ncbi:MAG: 2-hydroxyacyl-CoA dehydratase family protein, partial [Dehalococcoidia bacterium]